MNNYEKILVSEMVNFLFNYGKDRLESIAYSQMLECEIETIFFSYKLIEDILHSNVKEYYDIYNQVFEYLKQKHEL